MLDIHAILYKVRFQSMQICSDSCTGGSYEIGWHTLYILQLPRGRPGRRKYHVVRGCCGCQWRVRSLQAQGQHFIVPEIRSDLRVSTEGHVPFSADPLGIRPTWSPSSPLPEGIDAHPGEPDIARVSAAIQWPCVPAHNRQCIPPTLNMCTPLTHNASRLSREQ